ncbi:hypothetical protein EDB84DRAFT_1502896 [Lactarius hengduanensis]|nr:hypothetical protein EDB84DRAFT_1502896 [Lactarius hengduanensis]
MWGCLTCASVLIWRYCNTTGTYTTQTTSTLARTRFCLPCIRSGPRRLCWPGCPLTHHLFTPFPPSPSIRNKSPIPGDRIRIISPGGLTGKLGGFVSQIWGRGLRYREPSANLQLDRA